MAEESNITSNLEFCNYLRLQILVNKGSEILRNLFVTQWNSMHDVKWEGSDLSGNNFITGFGKDLHAKCSKIQKEHLSSGNITKWDLILLIEAVKCLSVNTEYNIFQELKSLRNKLAHLGEPKVNDEEYHNYWKQISILLLKLDFSPDEIEKVKTMPIEANNKSLDMLDPAVKKLRDSGNKAFKEGLYDGSIEFYTEAICSPGVSNKHLAVLYSNRSVAFLRLEDISSAKEDAKCSIHLFPIWWKGYFRLGMAYKADKKYQSALKNFIFAEQLHGKSSELDDQISLCKQLIAQPSRVDHFDSTYFCNTYEEMAKHIPDSTPESLRYYDEVGTKYSGICTQGHRYYLGLGVQRDYREAAKWFSKAAAKGNAEGMYNLAQMSLFGKGVQRNPSEGFILLQQAASKPSLIERSKECYIPNVGVKEAQHSLGLLYESGFEVFPIYKEARSWYTRAICNWSGASANNMAIMYTNGTGVSKCSDSAIQYWKLGAAMGNVKCMENLAREFFRLQDFKNMQRWCLYALEHGGNIEPTIEYQACFQDEINESFRKKEFSETLWHEVENGPLKHLIVPKIKSANDFVIDSIGKHLGDSPFVLVHKIDLSTAEAYRKSITLEHRKLINDPNRECDVEEKGNLAFKPVTDLFNLKPIYLEQMNKNNKDHIYDDFVLKLTVVEDPVVIKSECAIIKTIVCDEQKSCQRLHIHNYHPSKDDLQKNLGFGTKISIVNPYYRFTGDGRPAIRVDNFSTVFPHPNLKNEKICRYCGNENYTERPVPCRACKRYYYCCKKCLILDSLELEHNLVCRKSL